MSFNRIASVLGVDDKTVAKALSWRGPGVTILNDVVLNQVLVHFESDEITRDVIGRVQNDGTCWAGGATWQHTHVMRISVSNWSTTEDDVDQSARAIARCYRQSRTAAKGNGGD